MNILTIPLRSSRRKWLRSLLLLVVFTLGVSSIVALNNVSRVVGQSLEKKLTAFGANILVYPTSDTLTVSYGGFNLGDMLVDVRYLQEAHTTTQIRGIKNSANIASVAPKLVTMHELGGTSVGLVGVRFEAEQTIKGYWAVNGSYPSGGAQVLLGSAVAERLGLAPGDDLTPLGLSAKVSGLLLPTGSDDDNVVLADLSYVQELTGNPGAVSFVEVAALCAGCPIEDIVQQIADTLPGVEVKALQSIVKQRMYSVNFVKQLILAVSIIILLTACSMVGLSMLSAVNERKKEIGVLRSLGYSRRAIFGIFCFEALFIGALSGLVGYVAGYALSFKVASVLGITTDANLSFVPLHLLVTIGFVAVVTIISAAIPAAKASRIDPAEALISL
ncbi:ABC transporter permease [Desulfovibrio ferrophilus]|uniref:ABC transporter permease n=1 Tax=Desulfovibrio ferrophilus TaxID=241368 RepID=A0A2Z6AU99_9BACT|nr:FtsX-like permease family protein [Desulfovibrio ferrophilus]BBD06799.1 uncharacterized protein DFE_0073 [Desulfovibrio ferrophilus]